MAQKVYDVEYEKRLNEYFDASIPDKLYDAHFHISRGYARHTGYEGEPYEQFKEFNKKYTLRDLAGGLVMPQPNGSHTEETLADDNAYNLSVAKANGLVAGLIIRPQCGREKVEAILDAEPTYKVLKPYFCYSDAPNKIEADMLTFASEWMFSIANDREMPILVHLSHYKDMLSDPRNIEQINAMCKKYPKAKLVLAHCAMGHHVQKLIWGLEGIKGLDNVWFDCSGSTESLSIYHCIKNFGVEKMMYGGDFNHGATVGRIVSFGSNFIGFHTGYLNEEKVPSVYHYEPLNNCQEGILSLLQASEILGLKANDLEKMFYGNAAELYGF